MAGRSFRKVDFSWRRSLRASGTLGSLVVIFALGCATSAAPPEDRLSPAHLKNGPSMYETGRFGTVPLSSGGLKVDEGAIDRAPASRPAPARTAQRHAGKRKSGVRAQRNP
jgi:hypothetical protein